MRQHFTKLVFAWLLVIFGFFANAQPLEELMRQGDNYYNEFNHQSALRTYLLADSLHPGNWILMWKISRAYIDLAEKLPKETGEQEDVKKTQFEKALFYADSSVKLAPGEAEPFLRRASANGRIALLEGIFSSIGSMNDARDDAKRAIELGNGGNNTQAFAHYILGKTHFKVCKKPYLLRLPLGLGWGDMENSIRELEMAVKLKPNFRMFYLALAKAYMVDGQYEKAKETITQLEKAPFVDEDDDIVLEEAKELMKEVEEELE